MRSRRWLALIVGVSLVAIAGTLYALPEVVRRVAIARIGAITHRQVHIDGVDLDVLKGRLTVRGFRLAERGGGEPFADFERLDVRLRLSALLRRHLWLREVVLHNSTVRVVRFPDGFNFSDLLQGSGTTGGALDVTVDRFLLTGGTVTLEDRALPERRTWTSRQIRIEARNVSTQRDDGRAVGTSVTAGAPSSIQVEHLRLYPIHLEATVTVEGLDLALARLYLPPGAPVVLDRGRVSSTLKVALDARAGLRADMTGQFEDIALVSPDGRQPIALVPKLTAQLTDFAFENGEVRLGRFEVRGSASVREPSAAGPARFELSTVRASIADVTWPVTRPGQLDVLTSIPGGGTLAVTGSLRPPPAPSQLRLRLANLDLAPWTRFLPVAARVSGIGEADLRINEPLAAGVPTRINGAIVVNRLGVLDGQQELLGARRVEATGLQVHWPRRLVVKRFLVSEPRATVERDRVGGFPAQNLLSRQASVAAPTGIPAAGSAASSAPALSVEIGEILVRDGAIAWRDAAVTPAAGLDFSRIEARVTGVGWPLRGPLGVRVAVRPPRGGQVQAAGRVGLDPFTADLRISAKDADLAPYQTYVPTGAGISGWADLDLAVVLAPASEGRATARGDAALSRVDVREGQRTVMRIERAAATGLDVDWPRRVTVRELALRRPWILFERDEAGVLQLRSLLPAPAPPTPASSAALPTASPDQGGAGVAVALRQLVVDDGGVRVVDRSLSPPFAVDLQRLALRAEGLSTAPAKPARVELTGRAGPGSQLALRGTVGPVGGPLRLDVSGDLRGFWIPRTNPYVLRYVAWEAREGWLTTSLRCRIDRDALDAKVDTRLSRLQMARTGSGDEAKARIGLPLGLIVALLKDSHGDIQVSLPVAGRLSDPHFDFTEAIWSAVRTVAIKAITLPISWIGRVHVGADSRIEQIEIDPIRFEPGLATLTPEGQEQVSRLAGFLGQTPEVRMALTPLVSSKDLDALRQGALDAAIGRVAHEAGSQKDAAAARLFRERFPDRPLPDTPDAVLAALRESEPIPAAAGQRLAEQRVESVRATFKSAGIDPARLPQTSRARAQDAVEGRVELDLGEPGNPGRAGAQVPDFPGAAPGTTPAGTAAARQ